MSRECAHEEEILETVLHLRWPHGCREDLRAHVSACEVCRDVVAIASVLREDQKTSAALPVPSAGQVWWRAAVRARAEAAEAAARPMIWLQAMAAACAAGVGIALLTLAWPYLKTLTGSVAPTVVDSLRSQLPLVLAIGACLIAAPIAFYVALGRE